MAEEKKIATGYIGNALRSAADNHTTTFADEIFDTERQKYQNEVNIDLETTDNEIKVGLEAEVARAKAAEETNANNIAKNIQAITDEKNRAQAAEEAIIFDVSAHNDGAVFESISALLSSSNLSTLVPESVRHGGMTIRFIQGSEQGYDNNYVQFRCISNEFTTDITQWQKQGAEVLVSQNTQTGHTDIKVGDVTTPVASSQEIDGNTILKNTPANSTAILLDNIPIKAGDKYTLSIKSAGSITANSCGYFLVDSDNTNLISVFALSSAGTWDGADKSKSFVAENDTIAKITCWGDSVSVSAEVIVTLHNSNNLGERITNNADNIDNIVLPSYLNRQKLTIKNNTAVLTLNKLPLIDGHKYRFTIELDSAIQTASSWGIEDGVKNFALAAGLQSRTIESEYSGAYQEKRMFAQLNDYTGICYLSCVDITVDKVKVECGAEITSLQEETQSNIVGKTYSKDGTSTSGKGLTITITKNIYANRIIRLRADALSGLKVLYGLTYTDNTHNQKFMYGGTCELYATKDVKEVFIYIASTDNTYSGTVTLMAQTFTADSGNDGLLYSTTFVQKYNRVTNIKNVELIKGHTYLIVASADLEKSVKFYIDNNGTNLLVKTVTLTSNEQIVAEYTADDDYTPKLTAYRASSGDDMTINYKFYDKTVITKALWPRLNDLEDATARNHKLFANTVYVAASNASNVDKMAADYVCDGVNDEIEINQAIEDVGRCGTVVLLGGEFFIDAFTSYEGYGYCGIVVNNYNNEWSRSVMLKGVRHYFNGTKITVRQVAFDTVSSDADINVFNVLSKININRTQASWYVSLQDLFINIPTHSRKCVIVNLENAGCGEEMNLRISAFGNSDNPEEGASATREQKMAYNDELVGIRTFHGWTYGDTVRFDNIAVWGCGEAFQLGGEHLIACNLRARINKCGYSFGRYGLTSIYGAFDHPNTLINCCDEQSIYGPRFVFCGLIDTDMKQQYPSVTSKKKQCYTFIDFNCEAFEYPAEETEPGTFCGTIQFSSGDGTFGNSVTTQFWKNDGSGQLFRTINSSHALGGTTSLRNTYTPQYLQQYYDTTLSKLLIYDGTNWVDSEGNVVS